ncbi:hypothetical protein [Pontibacter chitinilyticus]|uniref:hypothetical protein n=1 Tax=Pontibacter chitinilyticus TaxID=2674989 RepID=UPI00321C00CD
MKILAILSIYLFGFGYVCQETTRVAQPGTKAIAAQQVTPATYKAVEAPMLEVVLDTVEISVEAPAVIASTAH